MSTSLYGFHDFLKDPIPVYIGSKVNIKGFRFSNFGFFKVWPSKNIESNTLMFTAPTKIPYLPANDELYPKYWFYKKSIFYFFSKMSKMGSGIIFRVPWPIISIIIPIISIINTTISIIKSIIFSSSISTVSFIRICNCICNMNGINNLYIPITAPPW